MDHMCVCKYTYMIHCVCTVQAHKYVDASLIRVKRGERMSTNQFALDSKRKDRWVGR